MYIFNLMLGYLKSLDVYIYFHEVMISVEYLIEVLDDNVAFAVISVIWSFRRMLDLSLDDHRFYGSVKLLCFCSVRKFFCRIWMVIQFDIPNFQLELLNRLHG